MSGLEKLILRAAGIRCADHAQHFLSANFGTSSAAAVVQSVYFACGIKATEFPRVLFYSGGAEFVFRARQRQFLLRSVFPRNFWYTILHQATTASFPILSIHYTLSSSHSQLYLLQYLSSSYCVLHALANPVIPSYSQNRSRLIYYLSQVVYIPFRFHDISHRIACYML
jgi:hypothetical protein